MASAVGRLCPQFELSTFTKWVQTPSSLIGFHIWVTIQGHQYFVGLTEMYLVSLWQKCVFCFRSWFSSYCGGSWSSIVVFRNTSFLFLCLPHFLSLCDNGKHERSSKPRFYWWISPLFSPQSPRALFERWSGICGQEAGGGCWETLVIPTPDKPGLHWIDMGFTSMYLLVGISCLCVVFVLTRVHWTACRYR